MFVAKWKNNSETTKPTYSSWRDMRDRCYNSSNPRYAAYGARGIRVCDRWREDYDAFVEDMGFRPSGMMIERINNDGDYTPENCQWATRSVQQRNRRDTIWLSFEGRTQSIADWADEIGVTIRTMKNRIKSGISDARLFRKERPDAAKHGTPVKYDNGCRCELCRKARSDYMREYRLRKKP